MRHTEKDPHGMEIRKANTRRSALRMIAALPALVLAGRPVLASTEAIDARKVRYHFRRSTAGWRKQKCFFCAHYTRQTRLAGTCSVIGAVVPWESVCDAFTLK
jgi:hypothetical protein